MIEVIKRIPFIGVVVKKVYKNIICKLRSFPGSEEYWIKRYNSGGTSGEGSYKVLAKYKAETINFFVKEKNIARIIEYGCGDGNQLKLAEYPLYIGYDISQKAIQVCQNLFQYDKTKSFRLLTEYNGETAQLTLSLDVIYHLIEDNIYYSHMECLFSSSERFVIIYSSDYDDEQKYHEKRRKFTEWIKANKTQWELIRYMPNRFPYNIKTEKGSLSDFYIYEKTL